MRPKHPHAAESGVGKHTARESERVQACAAGKERVTNAHPHKLAPETSKFPGPFRFYGRGFAGRGLRPRPSLAGCRAFWGPKTAPLSRIAPT